VKRERGKEGTFLRRKLKLTEGERRMKKSTDGKRGGRKNKKDEEGKKEE